MYDSETKRRRRNIYQVIRKVKYEESIYNLIA